MAILANFTEAQLEFAQENETQRLTEEFLDQPTPRAGDIGLPIPFFRRKRAAEEGRPSFADDVILTAIENERACNPVLRASANSILETTEG